MKKPVPPFAVICTFVQISAAFILIALLSAGCAYCEVRTSKPPANYVSQIASYETGEEVISLIDVEVESWKLFGFIPLVTGNVNRPNSSTYKMFKDYATNRHAGEVLRRWGTEGLYGNRTVVTRERKIFSGWWSLWIINYKAIRLEGEVLKF